MVRLISQGDNTMAKMIKPKSVDHFIETREKWKPEIKRLREILLSMELDEAIKWMFPCYMHKGKNVVGIGGFKSYFGLWFYEGASLKDSEGALVNAQEGKTKDMRQWRMTTAKDIKVRKIKSYVKEAIEISKLPKTKTTKATSVEVPPELHAILKTDRKAADAFGKLTPGRQRDYAEYIATAKRDETKVKRLTKILPLIKSGVGLNDKYR